MKQFFWSNNKKNRILNRSNQCLIFHLHGIDDHNCLIENEIRQQIISLGLCSEYINSNTYDDSSLEKFDYYESWMCVHHVELLTGIKCFFQVPAITFFTPSHTQMFSTKFFDLCTMHQFNLCMCLPQVYDKNYYHFFASQKISPKNSRR